MSTPYTVTANVPTSTLAFGPLNSRIDHARSLSCVLDFTNSLQYTIDLTSVSSVAQLRHGVQAVYIDCSDCLYTDTLFTVGGVGGQQIICPAGSQGYYPITVLTPYFIITNFIAGIYNNWVLLAENSINSPTVDFIGTTSETNQGGTPQVGATLQGSDVGIVRVTFFNVAFGSNQWQARERCWLSTSGVVGYGTTPYPVPLAPYNVYTQVQSVQFALSSGELVTGQFIQPFLQGNTGAASTATLSYALTLFQNSESSTPVTWTWNGDAIIYNPVLKCNFGLTQGVAAVIMNWRPYKAYGVNFGLSGYNV